MRAVLSFIIFLSIRSFSKIFYRTEVNFVGNSPKDFKDLRLVMLLNHTSLYEPLFLSAAPISFLWQLSNKMVAPGADKTLNRPIVGFFWKLMGPGFISITRKRDKSWFQFLKAIEDKSIILIAPEGRMKRKNGLDTNGKPMSVRSGVAEIIEVLTEGNIMIGYSGGLHHVQHPGDILPRLFKNIKISIEVIAVSDYKKQFSSEGIQLRKDIVKDLEQRLLKNTPQ